jgi:hypothetical protein
VPQEQRQYPKKGWQPVTIASLFVYFIFLLLMPFLFVSLDDHMPLVCARGALPELGNGTDLSTLTGSE